MFNCKFSKAVVMLLICALMVSTMGCASMHQESVGAGGIGAVIGGLTGALISKNPLVGAAIGAGVGALAIGGATEYGARRADQRNAQYLQTVSSQPSERTDCQKVTKRLWDGNRLVSEKVEEVCTGRKFDNKY